ncbi:MAG: phosphopantetheine-binding protein [Mycoplasmataceae bacterium]|jgi:acyl carrier protein|nr:phosphopantetheine-binding protein [Mycoplasmataceae bacterium]
MSNKKIIEAIRTAANEAGIKITLDPSTYDSTLKSLNIDSLNAMSIIINAEKSLNVRLQDDDLASLKTLGDLIRSFEKVIQ